MKKTTILAAALLALASPAIAQTWHPPTDLTLPKRYLRTIPLGISKSEVAKVMGLPVKEANLDGKLLWQYEQRSTTTTTGVFSGSSEMVQNYTFVFENEKLVDVRYVLGRTHYSAAELAAGK